MLELKASRWLIMRLMSECHIGTNPCMNYSIHHLAENRQTWQTFSEMEHDARHARLLIMPTLSSKLPHSNFAQDVEEQMEFGNLDNWVSQELQHFGPFIGQRGENVHLCPSSFWSCGIFCMQYTCYHPYMLFVFPGQKQAKKRTTLLRECVKNSSPNAAGRSCNSCRRHMISSHYIYIYMCSLILLWNYIYTLYIIPCMFWEVRNTASAAPVRHLPIRQDQEEPENDRGLRFSPVVRFRFFYSLLKELARLKVELSATGGQAMQHRCEA